MIELYKLGEENFKNRVFHCNFVYTYFIYKNKEQFSTNVYTGKVNDKNIILKEAKKGYNTRRVAIPYWVNLLKKV